MPSLSFVYPEALWLLLLLIPLIGLPFVVPRRLAPWQFWGSATLRAILLLALILSIAGTQLVQPVSHLTTVFLIDSSDSISPSARGQAETFVQAALQQLPEDDQAAIVVFGDQALVERAPSSLAALGQLNSAPVAARTNIEQAIELGLALLPADTQKRLVLLSDGGENTGTAMAAARLAAARDVPIAVVDLGGTSLGDEVLVADLDAPSSVRDGQEIDLTAVIESNTAQSARLRVFADQSVVGDETVNLQVGRNEFHFTVPAKGQGFQRYRLQVEPTSDVRVQNNEAAALIEIQGPPRVLLVTTEQGEAIPLRDGLQAANITAEISQPDAIPTDLAGLSAYDSVVLINVPARALPVQAMAALPIYVRDLGKGLVMIGGEESYGVGGYGRTPIEEAMPVYMDVRDREERPDLALVFVIDKSGSMDACHCSDPDRRDSQFRQGGERKVDIAKEAIVQASALLRPQDTLGVVAFDDGADWVLPATKDAQLDQVADAVSNIEPRGSTNVRAGLQAAETMLQETDARIKHVILLTDGWGHGGDNLDAANRMREQGVTLTVVAAGSGSATYLENLATTGGGRYYPSQTMSDVPQIFLQETIAAVGNYIIEQVVSPTLIGDSPIMHGFDAGIPRLYGYNGTTIKETARNILITADESPLLSQWQYGLGRSIAWTSDMKGKWGRDWVSWSQFPRFASQLVGWVLPVRSGQNVVTELQVEGSETAIRVQIDEEPGRAHNNLALTATLVDNDGAKTAVQLNQVAPGDYRGRLASPAPGTYLVQIAGEDGGRAALQEVAGLVVPYSPEYGHDQDNPNLLAEIAQATGGTALTEPEEVFAPLQQSVRSAQEIALPLLLLALLLLPLDIAVRRLMLRRRDFASVGAWTQSRLARNPAAPVAADPSLNRLAEAKRRATRSGKQPPASSSQRAESEQRKPQAAGHEPQAPSREPQTTKQTAPSSKPEARPPTSPPQRPASDDPIERLERLRQAKERARRRARGEEE
jgi:uncharacterized membrane protein